MARRWPAVTLVLVGVVGACSSASTTSAPESSSEASTASAGRDDPTESAQNGESTTPSSTSTGSPAAVQAAPGGPGELVDATASLGIDTALTGIRGHAVATADVNGDGWSDLFVGTFADRPIDSYQFFGAEGPASDRLLLGSPSGFVVDSSFEGRLGRTAGALFEDLDGDGDPDLVVSRNVRDVERGSAPSEIYRNENGSLVPSSVLDERSGGRAVVTTDFDGDGLLDLILVKDRWSRSSTVLFRNEGDLRFRDVTAELGFPTDVVGLGAGIGDLNGDGIDDLVVGGSNRWFLGTGNGFREAAGSPFPWALHNNEDDPAHVIITDTNDDGLLDVLIGQHFNSTLDFDIPEAVKLFLNRGTGTGDEPTFEDVTQASGMPYLGTKSPQILLLDLDGDGRQDVVTTASTASGGDERVPVLAMHRGVVGGLPSYEAPDVATGPHYWIDAVTLDANGDQRPDVFFVEWEPAIGSRIFLNLPTG